MTAVRTHEGVVDNGLIRLAPGVRLLEHAHVFVVVPEKVSHEL